MVPINSSSYTDEALIAYDDMMLECTIKVEAIAPLAVSIWSEVLKELDLRGKIRLISGSYDDVGNALIKRISR